MSVGYPGQPARNAPSDIHQEVAVHDADAVDSKTDDTMTADSKTADSKTADTTTADTEISDHERLTRNLNELLQELRVAQAGVQILFGFLLSIAFTERYAQAPASVRIIHLVTVLCAAVAVALFTAPAAWHRVLFRQGRRAEIVRMADHFALSGLIALALAMTGTIALLALVVVGNTTAVVSGVAAVIGFGLLWFVLPWRRRRVADREAIVD